MMIIILFLNHTERNLYRKHSVLKKQTKVTDFFQITEREEVLPEDLPLVVENTETHGNITGVAEEPFDNSELISEYQLSNEAINSDTETLDNSDEMMVEQLDNTADLISEYESTNDSIDSDTEIFVVLKDD